MKSFSGIIAIVGILLLQSASPGHAQVALLPEAQAAFDKGMAAAKQEEWDLAIGFFGEARKAVPENPQIIFNQGLAESHVAGREMRAVIFLEAYLERVPDAPNAAKIRQEIAGLEVRAQALINKLVKQANDLAGTIPNTEPKYELRPERDFIRTILVECVQVPLKDFKGAKKTASLIEGADALSDAYCAIAAAEFQNGQTYDAKKTLSLLRDLIADRKLRLEKYAGVASTVPDSTMPPHRARWFDCYQKLIHQQLILGDTEGATQSLTAMFKPSKLPLWLHGELHEYDSAEKINALTSKLQADIDETRRTGAKAITADLPTATPWSQWGGSFRLANGLVRNFEDEAYTDLADYLKKASTAQTPKETCLILANDITRNLAELLWAVRQNRVGLQQTKSR